METDAERHLGNVLVMLAELHADDRCQAFEDALAFYNQRHPAAMVLPVDGYSTRLLIESPLTRATQAAAP